MEHRDILARIAADVARQYREGKLPEYPDPEPDPVDVHESWLYRLPERFRSWRP